MGTRAALLMASGLAFALWGVHKMSGNNRHGPSWDRLVPEMRHKVLQLLDQAQRAGLSVMFFQGWRSPRQEHANQAKGTSFLSDALNSYHIWGAAADIVFKNALGQPYWPDASDPRWQQLGAIGKRLGLTWGGDWHHKDMAHFQLPISMAQLRQQYGNDFLAYLHDQGAIA